MFTTVLASKTRQFATAFLIISCILLAMVSVLCFQIISNGKTSDDGGTGGYIATPERAMQQYRDQVELYRTQHANIPPSPVHFGDQLCRASDESGSTTTGWRPTAAYPLGPYFQSLPCNPFNGKTAIGSQPSPETGWVYEVHDDTFTLRMVNATGDGVLAY